MKQLARISMPINKVFVERGGEKGYLLGLRGQ